MSYPRVSTFRTAEQFRARLQELGLDLPFDEAVQSGPQSPLAAPLHSRCGPIGNRWCILPMEGWDGTTSGGVTAEMRRRWQRFGASGAKLICGAEAMAVRPDGRANPNQLIIIEQNKAGLAELVGILKQAHAERYGTPLGQALRVLSQESRDQRMSEAEKKAAATKPSAVTAPTLK